MYVIYIAYDNVYQNWMENIFFLYLYLFYLLPVSSEVAEPYVVAGLGQDVGQAVLASGQPGSGVAHETVLQQHRSSRARDTVQLEHRGY